MSFPCGEHREIRGYGAAQILQDLWSIEARMEGCPCPFPSPDMMHINECPLSKPPYRCVEGDGWKSHHDERADAHTNATGHAVLREVPR